MTDYGESVVPSPDIDEETLIGFGRDRPPIEKIIEERQTRTVSPSRSPLKSDLWPKERFEVVHDAPSIEETKRPPGKRGRKKREDIDEDELLNEPEPEEDYNIISAKDEDEMVNSVLRSIFTLRRDTVFPGAPYQPVAKKRIRVLGEKQRTTPITAKRTKGQIETFVREEPKIKDDLVSEDTKQEIREQIQSRPLNTFKRPEWAQFYTILTREKPNPRETLVNLRKKVQAMLGIA